MLKITLATSFALLSLCLSAQPVVTSANISNNFTGEFYFALADGFNPGPAGANQTWNFSGLDITLAGTDTTIPVAGSPYAAQFPTANYLYKFEGMGGTRYYYHNLTSAKYEILSMAYDGTIGENYSPDPLIWVTFPYTFNTVFTDTYQSTDDEIATSFTSTYDAYGTLVLPTGTFTNVIRQKTVKNGLTNYVWYNVSPFFPLLQTVLEENALGIVKDTSILGVGDDEKSNFTIWPNPTQGQISLRYEGDIQNATVSLYDVTGKKVLEKDAALASGEFQLNLQDHSAGLYFLKVHDASNRMLFTSKVIKQ